MMFEQEVKKSVETLENKGVLLYPTDTVWGIGCDATDKDVVDRIFKIKNRNESKSLILLVSDIQMLNNYVFVSDFILNFLSNQDRPTTVIYQNPKGVASNVIAYDNTVAIRVVQDEFCQRMIARFGKPIVSTSANLSGEATPSYFSQINKVIISSVDYVVNYKQSDQYKGFSSRLVRIQGDKVDILRR